MALSIGINLYEHSEKLVEKVRWPMGLTQSRNGAELTRPFSEKSASAALQSLRLCVKKSGGYPFQTASEKPMQQLLVFWHWFTRVHECPPANTNQRTHHIFGFVGLLLGSLTILLLPSQSAAMRQTYNTTILWDMGVLVRAFTIILVGGWIVWRIPWRSTSTLERRQSRILLTITAPIFPGIVMGLIFDPSVYHVPISSLVYLSTACMAAQIMWLARRGHVSLGVALATFIIVISLFVNLRANPAQTMLMITALAILILNLLLHWWMGFIVLFLYPSTYLLVAPIVALPPMTPATILMPTVLLFFIAAITALYVRSLEAALQTAETQTAQLAEAQQHIEARNADLAHHADVLQATQAELERVVSQQQTQIAEAVYAIRQRSIELDHIQTPLIRVLPDVLVAPLIGAWNSERINTFVTELLHGIQSQRTHTAILDLTGITLMSPEVAHMIQRIVNTTRLLGCQCMLVGIQPEAAQSLIAISLDVSTVKVASDLADAVREVGQR